MALCRFASIYKPSNTRAGIRAAVKIRAKVKTRTEIKAKAKARAGA